MLRTREKLQEGIGSSHASGVRVETRVELSGFVMLNGPKMEPLGFVVLDVGSKIEPLALDELDVKLSATAESVAFDPELSLTAVLVVFDTFFPSPLEPPTGFWNWPCLNL
jgi:hypothetical protein